MNKYQKRILFNDLCARLPYGFVVRRGNEDFEFTESIEDDVIGGFGYFIESLGEKETIKPYLRPMSDMTESEEARKCAFLDDIEGGVEDSIPTYVDWLNERHFDHHGLIEKGLALVAPEGMYKSKK
jgi:hypothetical protein